MKLGIRKGGRAVEGSGLENRQGVHAPSWVRIPPLPPDLILVFDSRELFWKTKITCDSTHNSRTGQRARYWPQTDVPAMLAEVGLLEVKQPPQGQRDP